jgi:serine/threonine-protein kinase
MASPEREIRSIHVGAIGEQHLPRISIRDFEPHEWEKISRLMDHALDLDPAERATWLEHLASFQPELAGPLRLLLAEHQTLTSSGFLEGSMIPSTAFAAIHHATMAGKHVGAYTIERLLGSGGMGEVWLASRNDGHFEAQCAIKFLNDSAAQPRLVERFRQEGTLLARLAHPNIARLLDAGKTDDGMQFLVLEYVDGVSIDQYCDDHDLGVPERVRLFLDVAAAVSLAHSQLIIHRDLKPSNVLVTRGGTVKLLDFGIAKLLSAARPTGDMLTRVEELALTPEYAAPEQMAGEIPSTATDVYQLGMLLYVLLTRAHPLQLHGSRAERIKAALTSRLPRASEFAGGSLRQQLRGDLDAILGMALDPDPARRYPTAAGLHEELLRYLEDEPVRARRGARFYDVRKFIRRHRIAVAASAIAIATLCATSVFAISEAREAAQERDHALALASRNAAVSGFLGTLITDAAQSDKPVTVLQLLERSEKLALADTSDSPENRAAVLAMVAARYGTLSNHAKAARLIETGLALLGRSHDRSLRSELTCLHAGAVAELGQQEAAIRTLEDQIRSLDDDPGTAAFCLLFRSYIATNAHDVVPALGYAQRAYERFRAAPRQAAGEEGLFLGALGLANHLNGRNREADGYFHRALQIYAQLGREGSASATSVRNNWAIMFDGAGSPRRALEIYDRTLELHASSNQGETPPSYLIGNRAKALYALGRFVEARAEYQLEATVAAQVDNKMGQAHALSGLALVSLAMHDDAAAASYLREFSALLKAAVPAGAPPWRVLAIAQGKLDLDAGRFGTALGEFASALDNPTTSIGMSARLGKSEAELLAGNPGAAVEDARLALDAARTVQGNLPYSSYTGLAWLALARAQLKLGEEYARRSLQNAVEQLSNSVDASHPALMEARSLLTTQS